MAKRAKTPLDLGKRERLVCETVVRLGEASEGASAMFFVEVSITWRVCQKGARSSPPPHDRCVGTYGSRDATDTRKLHQPDVSWSRGELRGCGTCDTGHPPSWALNLSPSGPWCCSPRRSLGRSSFFSFRKTPRRLVSCDYGSLR